MQLSSQHSFAVLIQPIHQGLYSHEYTRTGDCDLSARNQKTTPEVRKILLKCSPMQLHPQYGRSTPCGTQDAVQKYINSFD